MSFLRGNVDGLKFEDRIFQHQGSAGSDYETGDENS